MRIKATYQTRIREPLACQVLDVLGPYLAPITRKTFKSKVAGLKITKSQLHKDYAIPNRYGHGIKVDVEGRLASYIKCLKLNIEQLTAKIAILAKKSIKEKNPKKKEYLDKKRNRKRRQLKKAKEELDSKEYSYTFGSNKLFKAQFHLKKNGYKNHQQWLDDWKLSRNYNFYIVGSKDESYGNQNCQLIPRDDGSFKLLLRIPDGLLVEENNRTDAAKRLDLPVLQAPLIEKLEKIRKGKYLVIKNLKLPKNETKKKKILRGFNFLREMLTSYKQAITTRFHKDKKGWIFSATTEYKEVIPTTNSLSGVIGVDINQHHLAIMETDRDGNPIHGFNIPLRLDGLSSNARNNLISHKVLELVNYARNKNKDIVVEDLNFTKKKRELGILYGSDYARMLSSFSYRKILNRIESSAYYRGVLVHTVNPAYSSIIGRFKFSKRYGLSIHQAAALVIGRRYLGFSERLPRSVESYFYQMGRHKVVLEKPAEDSKHPWKRWAKLLRQIKKLWTKRKHRTKDPSSLGCGSSKKLVPTQNGGDETRVISLMKEPVSTMRAVALGKH